MINCTIMQTETIFYIIIAGVAALLIALFQYIYKSNLNGKIKYYLFALRVLTVFGLLLLIINPKFESTTYFNEKPKLAFAIDNSESIEYLEQDSIANQILQNINSNSELNERFDIETYVFSKNISNNTMLSFNGKQSNISTVLKQFAEVYKDKIAPIVLVSDGNQTVGSDYSYVASQIGQPIYPIILGDSIIYSDIKIEQLNANRYTFLKNRFPVEVILSYSGESPISTEFRIFSGQSIVFRKKVDFSQNKTSEIINTTLLAGSVGIKTYRAEIVPLTEEFWY